MGLLGSRASVEKKMVVNSEDLLRAVFLCFHGQKCIFFLHCRVCTKKLLDTKVFFFSNLRSTFFFGVKNCFF